MLEIDINCDVGEGIGNDASIMPYISSCNIACGMHAGSQEIMIETIRLALKHGVKIGAHPSYPDKKKFGRKVLDISEKELSASIKEQINNLKKLVDVSGGKLNHIKPHGALYNEASRNEQVAECVISAVSDFDNDIIIYVPPESVISRGALTAGLKVQLEAFADRTYEPNHQLVDRSVSGAVLHDKTQISERVIQMVIESEVETISGDKISISPDTICVHGDNPQAVEIVHHLYDALTKAGITIS